MRWYHDSDVAYDEAQRIANVLHRDRQTNIKEVTSGPSGPEKESATMD